MTRMPSAKAREALGGLQFGIRAAAYDVRSVLIDPLRRARPCSGEKT
jgi:hypothetical protein